MNNSINRIAIFTSGGDAPGMNAAIRAVFRTASHHDLHVYGISHGYEGMINGQIKRLESFDVRNIIHRGGTVLKTSRSKDFRSKDGRKKAYDQLIANDIDACIAIGGNGTLTGASKFTSEYPDIPFIGLPGTIDNDLFGTDLTIGFDTAVNTAIEAVDKIRDTADSHNRLFFVEVMGRDSGNIALATALGSGAGDVLVPEVNANIKDLFATLKKAELRNKLFSVIIVAEGAKMGSAASLAEQVDDFFGEPKCRVTVIGHLQRGGSPSAVDRIIASRFGHAAIEAIIDGKRNIMIGLRNNKITHIPFEEAIEESKPFDEELVKVAKILAN